MKSYSQALKILKKSKIIIDDEYIKSLDGLNRVCASNIHSNVNYPSANNSSFDGYAINSRDTKNIKKKNPKIFKIIGSISAGQKFSIKQIKKYDAVEIMTGGIIPEGFDTVIPIEQINFHPNNVIRKSILINRRIKKYNNVRFAGSDYKKKQLIIKKGTIIQPNHILALKALGVKKIKVKKKINILFFSTGNEISNLDNIPSWKVRNSNSPYIESLRNNFLFSFINGGILKDNHQKYLKSKINRSLKSKVNIIITSGAVSAGKFDFIPKVVNQFKVSNYFKSAKIRPGKPILFARLRQKAIFGLPGNPISSAACFRFFVIPFMKNILGLRPEKPIKAILKNNYEKNKNLTRFVKSRAYTTKNGKIEVKILSGQESFRIQSFVKSNIWAMLPQGQSKFKKGQIIDCFFPNISNKILD